MKHHHQERHDHQLELVIDLLAEISNGLYALREELCQRDLEGLVDRQESLRDVRPRKRPGSLLDADIPF